MYQLTKVLAAEISPHIYYALRDLGAIIEKIILSITVLNQKKGLAIFENLFY